jgi:hypothetical protein
MKKYFVFAALFFVSASSVAQTMKEINTLMLLPGQNKKAKEKLDAFLAIPKNATNAEAWYAKGRVYNEASKDSSVSINDAMKLRLEAFDAFKKCQSLDASDVSMKNDKHVWYFDLFNGFFDIGAKEYNGKNFVNAFNGFKAALDIQDYVRGKGYDYNGYKYPLVDTGLVLNTAMAANQAKDSAAAIGLYRRITDAKIAGQDNLYIYQYLAEYYLKNKDEANFAAAVARGREVYPAETYWSEIEIDAVDKKGNKAALYAKFEELTNRYPGEYKWPYEHAVYLYNELYANDAKPTDAKATKAKFVEVAKVAIAAQGDKGADCKMLMTRFSYNDAYDYQDLAKSIKGMKPDEVKRRNEAKAMYLKKVDECIPYAQSVVTYYAAQSSLKPVQKSNYKIALDFLSQLYTAKNDVKKAAEYDKKKAEVEKM